MSKFLGPIHHWLFTKIKLHEALEKDLIKAFTEQYGEQIIVLSKDTINDYGSFIEDQPLEALIDTGNIHGWLQEKIAITETRQAAFLTKVLKAYGEDALKIALSLYSKQGSDSGEDARLNGQTTTAPDIYKSLNNYILDGMPCDNVNNISIAEPDLLEWQTTRCLHRGYWESVQADVNTLYSLRFAWIHSFVEKANENFLYKVDKNDSNGFIHKIIKK